MVHKLPITSCKIPMPPVVKPRGDCLIIGFDKGGNDKACLTVLRRKGRGYEIVKMFYDGDAEYLYEQLSDVRVMSQSRNITDFITRLIGDMEDSIDDYRDSELKAHSISEAINLSARRNELTRWINSLRNLRKEYEEVRNDNRNSKDGR